MHFLWGTPNRPVIASQRSPVRLLTYTHIHFSLLSPFPRMLSSEQWHALLPAGRDMCRACRGGGGRHCTEELFFPFFSVSLLFFVLFFFCFSSRLRFHFFLFFSFRIFFSFNMYVCKLSICTNANFLYTYIKFVYMYRMFVYAYTNFVYMYFLGFYTYAYQFCTNTNFVYAYTMFL
jgi:hypothetical protein